jgi:hypothetical protein
MSSHQTIEDYLNIGLGGLFAVICCFAALRTISFFENTTGFVTKKNNVKPNKTLGYLEYFFHRR